MELDVDSSAHNVLIHTAHFSHKTVTPFRDPRISPRGSHTHLEACVQSIPLHLLKQLLLMTENSIIKIENEETDTKRLNTWPEPKEILTGKTGM